MWDRLTQLTQLTQVDTLKVESLDEPRGSTEHKCYAICCYPVQMMSANRNLRELMTNPTFVKLKENIEKLFNIDYWRRV
jgi:hypothetical protein